MCKKPGAVCQAQDLDVPAEEDPSDDETDLSDDTEDSYASVSSSHEDGSDSEIGSASGNRITPNMVMYHMMKARGLMTEARYREMQDSSVNDESIQSVAPAIINLCDSEDSCNDNSFSFDSDDDDDIDDLLDLSLIGIPCSNMFKPADVVSQNSNEINNDACNKSEDAVKLNIDNETACKNDDTVENALEHEEKITPETSEEVTLTGKEELTTISETIKHALSYNEPETSEDNPGNVDENESLKETHDDDIESVKIFLVSAAEAISNPDVAKEEEVNRGIGQGTTASELKNNNDKARAENDIEIDGNTTAKDDNACGDNTEIKTNNGKITESIENILHKMMHENRIRGENFMILRSYAKSLDEFYDCNRAVHKFGKPGNGLLPYQHELLREFAIFLNYYSPSGYEYIRQTFITPLPNHKILSSWYVHSDDSPGLSKRAFEVLKRKAAGKRLLCSLMSHGFFLVNLADKYDQVDYGGGCNHKYIEKAMVAFVFVLVSLEENWKLPIGYIFTQSVPPESHAGLIRVCLSQCHEIGVDVVAVTLETPSPAEFLGCSFTDVKNLKTTFKHPSCERDVAVWIDPCLALRSVHYTLKNKIVLYNNDNDKIRWALIRKLRSLYFKNPINYQVYFSPPYMALRNHVAKVGLTTAIFSESLVKALSLCQDVQPDRFRNIAPTQQFIENINKLFDILNSTLTDDTGFRRAVDVNSTDLFPMLDELKAYIIGIFCKEHHNDLSRLDSVNLDQKLHTRSFVAGEPVCGFVSFLICIESLKHLFNSLIKTGKLTRLATHRLCKDHVEDFIKKMRYYENLEAKNFTGTAFRNYYNKLHQELSNNARLSERNVRLDYSPIQNQRSPHDEIKYTSGKRTFDEDYSFLYKPKSMPRTSYEFRSTNILRAYSINLDKESDQAVRKNIVAYLAGWIATKFANGIKCEVCVDALITDKKLWFHKFITLKEIKGMCYPSEELFRVCWECERVLKGGYKRPQLRTFQNLLGSFPWKNLGKHHPLHHIHLVRAIILRYIPLRIAGPLTERENNRMIRMLGLMNCVHMAGST